MNARSLAHNIIKNQELSSWKDDPFQLGAYFVKGLATMNHKSNLSHYANDLVSHYAKYDGDTYTLCLSSLSDDDQNELIRLYIESTGRDTSECVYGDDFTINSDFTCALLSMLKNDNKASREHFADVTRRNLLIYYKDSLNEILEAACDNFLHMQMNENGYHAQQDMEHGDILWRKY